MSGSERHPPDFLSLPTRPGKPRTAGVTHVLDKGLPLASLQHILGSVGAHIDVWKFGYGLSYVDAELSDKLALLEAHRVRACPGGTLAEICWLQDSIDDYYDWLERVGMRCVEISNGATGMPVHAKRELISRAADRGFEVFAEVGSKDPAAVVRPTDWVEQLVSDIGAGATWIVAEGRESGTVGMYDSHGRVRTDLVEALESASDDARVIYEAPLRTQQAWLIRHIGPNVNIGNLAVDEILSLEALRLGLRADTLAVPMRQAGG